MLLFAPVVHRKRHLEISHNAAFFWTAAGWWKIAAIVVSYRIRAAMTLVEDWQIFSYAALYRQ
jgi:hypothetical protein